MALTTQNNSWVEALREFFNKIGDELPYLTEASNGTNAAPFLPFRTTVR